MDLGDSSLKSILCPGKEEVNTHCSVQWAHRDVIALAEERLRQEMEVRRASLKMAPRAVCATTCIQPLAPLNTPALKMAPGCGLV